jgi:hypothetical protein
MPTPEELVNSIFGGDTGAAAAPEENNDDNPETRETPEAPENQPDTPEGESKGDKQPEKLLAGKYRTVEELEAAYKEAERNFHGSRQELAELRREFEALKQLLAPKQPEPDLKQYREKLLERLYEEPDAVIAELAERIADRKLQEHLGPIMPVIQQQIINNQVQQFMSAVPDAAEYAGDMATIIQANPELVNQPGWLEKAYLQAKVARLEAKLGKNAAGEKAAQAAAAKQAAAMPKGGKGEPPAPKTQEEKLVDAIFGGGGGGGIFG